MNKDREEEEEFRHYTETTWANGRSRDKAVGTSKSLEQRWQSSLDMVWLRQSVLEHEYMKISFHR